MADGVRKEAKIQAPTHLYVGVSKAASDEARRRRSVTPNFSRRGTERRWTGGACVRRAPQQSEYELQMTDTQPERLSPSSVSVVITVDPAVSEDDDDDSWANVSQMLDVGW